MKKLIRIIKGDIERTRVQESIYMKSFKKYKLSITFTRIYSMMVCFIDKFLTNYFHDLNFIPYVLILV